MVRSVGFLSAALIVMCFSNFLFFYEGEGGVTPRRLSAPLYECYPYGARSWGSVQSYSNRGSQQQTCVLSTCLSHSVNGSSVLCSRIIRALLCLITVKYVFWFLFSLSDFQQILMFQQLCKRQVCLFVCLL